MSNSPAQDTEMRFPPERYLEGMKRFIAVLPQCQALKMQAESADHQHVLFSVPFADHLIGNSRKQLIHGGVISTLLDTACGSVAVCALPRFEMCPTLDLRIDHLRPAVAGKTLFCKASIVKVTPQIIFTEGVVYQEEGKPVSRAVANFMRLGADKIPVEMDEALFADTDSSQKSAGELS
ncbi:PaaI family thioesterase [Oceanospirillum sanctuarii]|uniref:PaaI family thioesterase n=1 Tax=Oceanospirillum sanctuarii TaxID=1434821 RepID=UPI001C3DCB05|nr:PaaI family thioesterase [Oceanospirillum sanctuarii]